MRHRHRQCLFIRTNANMIKISILEELSVNVIAGSTMRSLAESNDAPPRQSAQRVVLVL